MTTPDELERLAKAVIGAETETAFNYAREAFLERLAKAVIGAETETAHYAREAFAEAAPHILKALSERAELLATVRRQGDLLAFMAAYIGTPAKERETQWPAWSATESKKEAVADYWAELARAAIIQTERERDKQLDQK